MTTTSPLRTHTQAADLILSVAEGSGLPMPISVCSTNHDLTFQFRDGIPVEWTDWAGSPEVVVTPNIGGSSHRATGTLFDHPVELTAWVAS